MFRKLSILLILSLILTFAYADLGYDDDAGVGFSATSAESVETNTTNFNGTLSGADDEVQKALDTLDDAIPGLLASTNTWTGENTFTRPLTVTTTIFTDVLDANKVITSTIEAKSPLRIEATEVTVPSGATYDGVDVSQVPLATTTLRIDLTEETTTRQYVDNLTADATKQNKVEIDDNKASIEGLASSTVELYYTNETPTSAGYYLVLIDTPPSGAESTITSTIDSSTVIIASFTTETPLNLDAFLRGLYHSHFHAKVDNATKDTRLRAEVWKGTGTAVSFIFSTIQSNLLTTDKTYFDVHTTTNEIVGNVGLFEIRIVADTSGGGPDPVVTFYMEGDNASLFEMPSLSKDSEVTRIIAGIDIVITETGSTSGRGEVTINSDSLSKSSGVIIAQNIDNIASNKDEIDELHLSSANQRGLIDSNKAEVAELHGSTLALRGLIDSNKTEIDNVHGSTLALRGLIDSNKGEIDELHLSTANQRALIDEVKVSTITNIKSTGAQIEYRPDGTDASASTITANTHHFRQQATFTQNNTFFEKNVAHDDDENTRMQLQPDFLELYAGGLSILCGAEGAIDSVCIGDDNWDFLIIGDTTTVAPNVMYVSTYNYATKCWSMPFGVDAGSFTASLDIFARRDLRAGATVYGEVGNFSELVGHSPLKIKSPITVENTSTTFKAVGTNVNSPELVLEADDGGVKEIATLQVIQGADPYLRVSVSDDGTDGEIVNVIDIHDTVLSFVNDNTVDIGASGANRPKDYFGSGNIVTAGTIDTNGTPTEVHAMNQDIQTSDAPTFAGATYNGAVSIALGYLLTVDSITSNSDVIHLLDNTTCYGSIWMRGHDIKGADNIDAQSFTTDGEPIDAGNKNDDMAIQAYEFITPGLSNSATVLPISREHTFQGLTSTDTVGWFIKMLNSGDNWANGQWTVSGQHDGNAINFYMSVKSTGPTVLATNMKLQLWLSTAPPVWTVLESTNTPPNPSSEDFINELSKTVTFYMPTIPWVDYDMVFIKVVAIDTGGHEILIGYVMPAWVKD